MCLSNLFCLWLGIYTCFLLCLVCFCIKNQLVLEMCQGEEPVDMQTIQPHLDRIKAPVSTAKDHHVRELWLQTKLSLNSSVVVDFFISYRARMMMMSVMF